MFCIHRNGFEIFWCAFNSLSVTKYTNILRLGIVLLFVVIVVFTSKKFLQQRYRYVKYERVFLRCVLDDCFRSQLVWLRVLVTNGNDCRYR